MRMSSYRWWLGTVVLVIAFGGLGGCRMPGPGMGAGGIAAFGEDNPARLNNRQAADVQVALGRSCETRGETERALAAYADAVKRDPRRTDAYLRLAILSDMRGKFQDSAEYYRKALQSSPGNPDIFCDMGYSLYLQRRWAEAEMNLQQALALKPDLARAHNNLGLVLAHTDRTDLALAQFRQAGSEADARLNLALALTMDQRWEEARTQYEQALAANPTFEQAKMGLHQLNDVIAHAGGPKSTTGPGNANLLIGKTEPTTGASPAQTTVAAKMSPPAPASSLEIASEAPAPVVKASLDYVPLDNADEEPASFAGRKRRGVSDRPKITANEEPGSNRPFTLSLAQTFIRFHAAQP